MTSSDAVEQYVDGNTLTHNAWKQALRAGHIIGQECTNCNHRTAAPKAACTRCGGRDLNIVELPTEGTVFSETTLAVTPEQFSDEFQAGIVDLGVARIMAQFEVEVEIGDVVELVGTVEEDSEPGPLFG